MKKSAPLRVPCKSIISTHCHAQATELLPIMCISAFPSRCFSCALHSGAFRLKDTAALNK